MGSAQTVIRAPDGFGVADPAATARWPPGLTPAGDARRFDGRGFDRRWFAAKPVGLTSPSDKPHSMESPIMSTPAGAAHRQWSHLSLYGDRCRDLSGRLRAGYFGAAIDAGVMPTLARIAKPVARIADCVVQASPINNMSIATGQPPVVHGIAVTILGPGAPGRGDDERPCAPRRFSGVL